ncbi:hypothetical protein L3V82_05895 [Thiotrichales bacterium 19S3-7]|nr:hypothetical protein [Thiotrichales bacterium 19S3-7]MCF6801627.1 hypothetical protein [Thiotrichales bacterium 19S3-11]
MIQYIKHTLINCLRHPSMIYFFVLPIYVPIRTLAEYIIQYKEAFPDATSRFYFFVSSVVIGAFVSIIIYFVINHIIKAARIKKNDAVIAKIGILCPLILLATTYLLLNDQISIQIKYIVMGAHFFLIRYLTNYVILATKYFKMEHIPDDKKAMANNIIHLNVNFLGIIINFAFILFLITQSTFLFLESVLIIGCIYYYIQYVRKTDAVSITSLLIAFIIFTLGIVTSSLISFIMFESTLSIYLMIMLMFVYLTVKLLNKAHHHTHVYHYIAGSFNYGVLLFPIISSLIIFLLYKHHTQPLYQYIYSFEPPISAAVAILFTYLLAKNKIKTHNAALFKSTKYYGLVSFLSIILLWIITYDNTYTFLIAAVLFFIAYSTVEYIIQFNLIQMLLQNNYDTSTTTLFNIYFTVIIMGVIPVLFLWFQSMLNQYFNYDFYQALPISAAILFSLGLGINFIGGKVPYSLRKLVKFM